MAALPRRRRWRLNRKASITSSLASVVLLRAMPPPLGYPARMERRLPPEYAGWQKNEAAFRRLRTPELVVEIQDGSPDRRLAALSVIDLAEVAQSTVEDWIRT